MKATLLDYMGTDMTVVDAARVSFGKQSSWDIDKRGEFTLPEKDIKLIHYLASHEHWSPFAHPQLSFHIEAPIFVARQLAKHQVGGVWNEVSRRYVDGPVRQFDEPEWRARAEDKKQGSGEPSDLDVELERRFYVLLDEAESLYYDLVGFGYCPEQARMVLPLSTYTEWHWTGSLAFFARVAKLRLSEDTQQETRELVQQISEQIEPLFPHSWKALCQS